MKTYWLSLCVFSTAIFFGGCGKGATQLESAEIVTLPLTGIAPDAWAYDKAHRRVVVRDETNGKIVFVDMESREGEGIEILAPNVLDMDLHVGLQRLAIIFKKEKSWAIALFSIVELQPILLKEVTLDAKLEPKQIVLIDDEHAILGLLDDRNHRRLAKLNITTDEHLLTYFGKDDTEISTRDEMRKRLYAISFPFPYQSDLVTEWNIESENVEEVKTDRLLAGNSDDKPVVVTNTGNTLVFGLSRSSGKAYGGRIPVYKSGTFEAVGSINVEWQPIALALTTDSTRGIVAHADYVINATEISSHDQRVADVHVYHLQKPGFPLLGTYAVPGPVVPNGLMTTDANEIIAVTKTGAQYDLVVIKP